MREVIGTKDDLETARQLCRDFVYDPELHREIVSTHFVDAFDAFCRSYGFDTQEAFQRQDGTFDARGYVDFLGSRRAMLNAFILAKPHLVVARERLFTFEFLSEFELAIYELSANEVADAVNELMRPDTLIRSVREWWTNVTKRRRQSRYLATALKRQSVSR